MRTEGARTVGTSLTAEFWERFTLLLLAAIGVSACLTALFDALALRRANRRAHQPPVPADHPSGVVPYVRR